MKIKIRNNTSPPKNFMLYTSSHNAALQKWWNHNFEKVLRHYYFAERKIPKYTAINLTCPVKVFNKDFKGRIAYDKSFG